MKNVNFKKWIIVSVISFVLMLVFLGASIFSGGSSIIRALGNMDNWFDDGFSVVSNGMMHDDSYMMDFDSFMMDDDVAGHQIATNLESLTIIDPITTKAQLDAYLQQIATEASSQTLSASDKENLIDVVEDTVNFYFDTTPLPTDALATDDYEDYFERTQLGNTGCSDYIENTLRTLL